MIVVAPHPTEELKLIKYQKALIKKLFVPGVIIYAHQPLWIETDFTSVQEAKESITGVTLTGVEYDESSGIITGKVMIDPRVKPEDDKKIITKQPLIHIKGTIPNIQSVLQDTSLFPLPLKIFRLGECTCPSPGVYELKNTVWKKLS